jgi:hypothetical protein
MLGQDREVLGNLLDFIGKSIGLQPSRAGVVVRERGMLLQPAIDYGAARHIRIGANSLEAFALYQPLAYVLPYGFVILPNGPRVGKAPNEFKRVSRHWAASRRTAISFA